MKTSGAWNFRSIVSKIMMVLVLAAMIGSIDVVPSFGKDDHKDKGRHDNGRKEVRGRGYDRHVQGRPYGYYGHGERDYYPPPPVVYEPPPPPGISIFLPPIYIR